MRGACFCFGFLLVSLFCFYTSAGNTRCFPLKEGGSLCFIQPNPLLRLSWSNALQWCKNFEATLPIPGTKYHNLIYGNALDYFGLHTEILWVGANSTYDSNKWYWTNGVRLKGITLVESNVPGNSHAVIVRNGSDVQLVAASPLDLNHYLCQHLQSEVWCASYANSYWTSGKCYIKYRFRSSWYSSWHSCGENDGLAFIDNLNEFSRWLDDLQPVWIGLRCSWWTWHDVVSGTSYDVTESQFVNPYPNGASPECLASYKDDNFKSYQWINQGCNTNLQFICQQYVSQATSSNPSSESSIEPSSSKTTLPKSNYDSNSANYDVSQTTITSSTAEDTSSNPFSESSNAPSSSQTALPKTLHLAFAVGIGGVLILGLIIWVSILTAYSCKRTRIARVFPM